MKFLRPPLFVTFLGITLLFGNTIVAADPTIPTIHEIIRRVHAAEKVLKNIEIDQFSFSIQLLHPGSTTWTNSGYIEQGTAWYNGLRDSKARIHITRLVTPWVDGPNPWGEIQMDVGFNGQLGRIVYYRSGPRGNTTPSNDGTLLSKRPSQLNDRYQAFADGTAYSLYFYRSFGNESQPLSDQLQKYYDGLKAAGFPQSAPLTISWDNIYGDKCVKIMFGTRHDFDAFWLDSSHGWALRKVEQKTLPISADGHVYHRLIEVPKITEAAPGIWFPLQATRQEPYPPKAGWQQRLVYHADGAIANNPNFDEGIFTVPFPPRYNISDEVRGIGFTTVSAQQTAVEIDKDLALLKEHANASTHPASEVKPNKNGGVANKVIGAIPSHGSTALYVVIAVCGALGIVALIWGIKRQRGKHVGIIILGLLIPLAMAQSTSATSIMKSTDAVRSNCGINVAYIGLQWFGKKTDFLGLSHKFGIDDVHDAYLSLADIKHVWEKQGIEVKGYEADGIKAIIHAIPSRGLAVIRLSRMVGGVDVGHFIVLIPDASGISIVDPPNPVAHMTMEQTMADRDLASCAKEFLVAMPKPTRTGPGFYTSATTVDMGRIPIGTNDFSGHFQYENHGDQILKILNTHKSCSCMQPPTGDFEVPPGGRGTIDLKFTRSKIAGGLNRRSLLLETNDPAHKKVLVMFKFDLAVVPKPVEANIIPRAIDYGRESAAEIVKEDTEIEVDVPVKVGDAKMPAIHVTASTPDLRIGPITDAEDQEPLAITGGASYASGQTGAKPAMVLKAIEFKVHWLHAPKGLFNAEIQVDISGAKPFTMKVPIRGECISG